MSRAGKMQPIGIAVNKVVARVTERRLADVNHAVITVKGGGGQYRRSPCPTCPWRKDAVGIFPAQAFRLSANTATDGSKIREGDDTWTHTFVCHQSRAGKPLICAGYILNGSDAIGWRIAVTRGKFDPARVQSDVPLWTSYREMAEANGVSPNDKALQVCKP